MLREPAPGKLEHALDRLDDPVRLVVVDVVACTGNDRELGSGNPRCTAAAARIAVI
ncbi:MAG TPA: hypothetical protein VHZ03_09660 [Trebonia sp.]|jgi:hypothetical protein|nr:hypothetical protein [Trebonia sp.]